MKKTNKSKEIKNEINSKKIIILNNKYSSFDENKEKIIKDLRQKGFTEMQIKDIFESFNLNIKENRRLTINKNKEETFNINNLKNSNSTIKTFNDFKGKLLNKNNSKNNYLKLNVNTSKNKSKKSQIITKNKNDININKKDLKVINLYNKKEENKKHNNSYSRKYKEVRNIKIGNYIKKFNSHNNYVTDINTPKKMLEKKYFSNKNNLLKIIPINKKQNKTKRNINDFNNDKLKNVKRNDKNALKNRVLKLSKDYLNIELKKEKTIHEYIINKSINLTEEKSAKNQSEKENIIKENIINNKIKIFDKKLIPVSSKRNKNLNFLKIRKQSSKEDDNLAKRNTGIIEITIENKVNSSRYSFNKYKQISLQNQTENNIRFNTTNENILKKYNTNNHNFLNINTCKEKNNNDLGDIKDKILTKQNSFPNFKYQISIRNDENKSKNYVDKDNNKKRNIIINQNKNNKNYFNNHIIYRSYNSKKECFSYNSKYQENEKNDINKYNNQIKMYDIGKYEGIIVDNKRELNGVMIYNNGARYEGGWKNDKKYGKGIYISSHYFNCENNLGFKYEGEFKNDKFEGFGIATYSNGDRYEGEWKNNKQYGRGTLTNIGGTKYIGEWLNGIFDGNGVYYMNNGERYEGHFSNNKYNGYGKYYYINGDYLEGIFKEDRPSINCILHRKLDLI